MMKVLMKLITKASLVTIAICAVIGVGLATSCDRMENLVPEESDLVKYPEIQPFLAGRTGFRGIRFNVDTNFYSFAFPTSFNNGEAFFNAVHLGATRDGWVLVRSDGLERVYCRPSNAYPAATHFDKVSLRYNPEKTEVVFVLESASSCNSE